MPAGTYIAHHPYFPWIACAHGAVDIVKVGESGRLGDRLFDSCYTTLFPPGWFYVATYETESKEDAQRLEAAMLAYFADARITNRETLALGGKINQMGQQHIVEALARIARNLGIDGVLKLTPQYERENLPKEIDEPAEPPSKSALPPTPSPSQDSMLREELGAASGAEAPAGGEDAAVVGAAAAETDAACGTSQCGIPECAAPERPFVAEERAYQTEAREACISELDRVGRTTLIMACRCGKTWVAHMVIRHYLQAAATVLFLVPWLQLLQQTRDKLNSYFGDPSIMYTMIGSDPGMTTSQEELLSRAAQATRAGKKHIIITTYKSSHVAAAAGPFTISVFDECHNVCGSANGKDGDFRPNSYMVMQKPEITGKRLFMTATPYMDPKADITMSNPALFGGVAYRYTLRQGIDAKYVNDFELQLVPASQDMGDEVKTKTKDSILTRLMRALVGRLKRDKRTTELIEDALPTQTIAVQVRAAYDHLTSDPRRNKLLVFCREVKDCEEIRSSLARAFEIAPDKSPPELVVIHSGTPKAEKQALMQRLEDPKHRAIVINCNIFKEGVEIALLNGVFFATPRHSPVFITQAMCRCLTKVLGLEKGPSVIYIPVPPSIHPEEAARKHMIPELERFSTLLPFFEALWSTDPRFLDYLLDPQGSPYPIGWVGIHGTAEDLLARVRRAIRFGCRRSTRRPDKLTEPPALPWAPMFAHLKRCVEECERYPKKPGSSAKHGSIGDGADLMIGPNRTAMRVSLSKWFHDWIVPEYQKYMRGEPSGLEVPQVKQLKSLEEWHLRGGGGEVDDKGKIVSNPLDECIGHLENILQANNGALPYISTGSDEWAGIRATDCEMLSGFFRIINQQDSRTKFKVDAEKARRMDKVCAKWNLRWRKDRAFSEGTINDMMASGRAGSRQDAIDKLTAAGAVAPLVQSEDGEYAGRPTFIQEAASRLAEAKANSKHGSLPAFIRKGWPGMRTGKYKNYAPSADAAPVKYMSKVHSSHDNC